jgi:outer membrane lipoprotein carrier protein
MKFFSFLCSIFLVLSLCPGTRADENVSKTGKLSVELENIIARVEARYAVTGFSATFKQISTLKAMQITDHAFGKISVKRPGKMRWVYERPEQQVIISDGASLWIYRPGDYQVMVGKAPEFFGEGRGAAFLSDMSRIRDQFLISLEPPDGNGDYVLKLVPVEKNFDLSMIYLVISKNGFEIKRITTYNEYEDETRIDLTDIEFVQNMDDALFHFDIPEGVDILQLDK